MRAPALATLLVALGLAAGLVPVAAAQTHVNPIEGSYADVYLVSGRIVDASGLPVAGATLRVEVDQEGVRAAPFEAKTSCFGDFIFTLKIGTVLPDGRFKLTLLGAEGGVEDLEHVERFDPFFRRSDVLLRSQGTWRLECPDQGMHWPGRLSVTGRIVNRTDPYEVNGTTLDARPYVGYARIFYYDGSGGRRCPPSLQEGLCDPIPVDERGDFRYSFTYPGAVPAQGRMELHVDNRTYNASIDPVQRIAIFELELSGRGAPDPRDAPGLPVLAVLAALGALAAVRNVLGRKPR